MGRMVCQSLFRTHWATIALVVCICFKIQSLSYSSQITTLERRKQAGRGEMGDRVLQNCGERRGLFLMLGSRGVERRRNVRGRGKKKPEALEAGDKPLAVVGRRPLVAPSGLGPPSFWN